MILACVEDGGLRLSLDGRIESFHGGLAEQVQYVEGCL